MIDFREEFTRIISNESKLSDNFWVTHKAEDIYNITYQISEVAKSARVLRSYNNNYGLTKAKVAYESVSAHTNLMATILDRALYYNYTSETLLNKLGYSYREIMETVRLHDLPENLIGDIPDNGSGDSYKKRFGENLYYAIYYGKQTPYNPDYEGKIRNLLKEMEGKSTEIGKLLYCADKAAAIIMTLQYDYSKTSPLLKFKKKLTSKRDREEMLLCDTRIRHHCLASEMWTIDWFKVRRLIDYDTSGFFTSIIIMKTLQVRKHWYFWREQDYS